MAENAMTPNERARAPRPYAPGWLARLDHLYTRLNHAAIERRVRWGMSGIPHRAHGAGAVAAAVAQLRSIMTTEQSIDALCGAVSIHDELEAVVALHETTAQATGRAAAHAAAVAGAEGDAAELLRRVAGEEDPEFVAAFEQLVATVCAAAYGTVILGDVLDDTVRHRGWAWVLAVADPRGASAAYGAALPAPTGGGIPADFARDPALTLLHAAARSATLGHGAPLWQNDRDALAALRARGWIAT